MNAAQLFLIILVILLWTTIVYFSSQFIHKEETGEGHGFWKNFVVVIYAIILFSLFVAAGAFLVLILIHGFIHMPPSK